MPSITFASTSITQEQFEKTTPGGDFEFFRDRFADQPSNTQPITYVDPVTGIDTGQQVREVIAAQALTHGWPLVGIYISGSPVFGPTIPHFAVHMSDFPVQGGNPGTRADALQEDLNGFLEGIYKTEQTITDPTDPDFGQAVDIRNFWAVVHVWNYQQSGIYTPREPGPGDIRLLVSDSSPPGNWWQEF